MCSIILSISISGKNLSVLDQLILVKVLLVDHTFITIVNNLFVKKNIPLGIKSSGGNLSIQLTDKLLG